MAPMLSILLLFLWVTFNHTSFALNSEGYHLLSLKRSLSDPAGFLSAWSDRDPTPCNWTGVSCNPQGLVVSLNLSSASLAGPFPVQVCRLPSLARLNLDNNDINSSLPLSISDCRNLYHLDLSNNLLVGSLPPTLADIPFLRYLNLESNNFSGEIPVAFGLFRQLEFLRLTENLLTGTIPSSLGNVTSLRVLILAYNRLTGVLPQELGNLTNLENLWLSNCYLTGPIPASFGRLIRLQNFDVSTNKLTGSVKFVVHLTRLVQLELYNNAFSGSLPIGWSNLTELRRFDGSTNMFTGTIPSDLCELPLESLNLYENKFVGPIPASIAKSPNLYELKLFGNRFSGSLPSDLGKNSPLRTIDVSYSNLSGEIPPFLCEKGALEALILLDNAFSGKIPQSLGNCQSLKRVRMLANKLYGDVPAKFWGLPSIAFLELSGNAFSGSISPSIQGAKNLATLDISMNNFSGRIPIEIGSLNALVALSAHDNALRGGIPSSITNLGRLMKLDLSNNRLSGGLPDGIQNMKALNELDLSNNALSGPIPDEMGSLPVLNYLDLSCNDFSGDVPVSLQNLKLNQLNLSSNALSGVVPPLFVSGAFRDSFLGNPNLCMNISGICQPIEKHRTLILSWLMLSIIVVVGIVSLTGIVWFLLKCKKLKQLKEGTMITKWTSFHKLDFSESEISKSLKESNVIGRGSSGQVYKVILSNGETVAVKKMHERPAMGDSTLDGTTSGVDEFLVEVETLGSIRHKNIVKLWCCCDMGSCKLLVYEYMPNGSLGDVLHLNKGKKSLDWPMRFSIALDAAEGLSYLHHDTVPPIVHRDVKSNNILLDEEFGAKISDFGVAKIIKTVSYGAQTMSVIAGSCGYIAPEYAYTLRVNEKSDIYSFGIVILELATGKRPVSPEYGEKDLSTWVCTALDKEGIDRVIDPELDPKFRDHVSKVLNIGLLCTSRLPVNRPSMRRVVNMLQELASKMPVEDEPKKTVITIV